jgi:hypothetical protein
VNIHAHHKDRSVRALATGHRRLVADFPGWGSPGHQDFLLPIPPGLSGVVSDVESHGTAPWTRYSVRFPDGTSASGLSLGQDIEFADQDDPRTKALLAHAGQLVITRRAVAGFADGQAVRIIDVTDGGPDGPEARVEGLQPGASDREVPVQKNIPASALAIRGPSSRPEQ